MARHAGDRAEIPMPHRALVCPACLLNPPINLVHNAHGQSAPGRSVFAPQLPLSYYSDAKALPQYPAPNWWDLANAQPQYWADTQRGVFRCLAVAALLRPARETASSQACSA